MNKTTILLALILVVLVASFFTNPFNMFFAKRAVATATEGFQEGFSENEEKIQESLDGLGTAIGELIKLIMSPQMLILIAIIVAVVLLRKVYKARKRKGLSKDEGEV